MERGYARTKHVLSPSDAFACETKFLALILKRFPRNPALRFRADLGNLRRG